MAENLTPREQILKSLQEKAGLKLDVHRNLEQAFLKLKSILKSVELSLKKDMAKIDSRVMIRYTDRGPFDAEFRVSDDILIFSMSTNAYTFADSHSIWKSSYIEQNKLRTFCGIISIYNFLTDSFNYNRASDAGFLIARIFINIDNHFFVEGKKQLGYLFNDFENSVIDEKSLNSIIESTIKYSLDLEILTPPFEKVNQLSVEEVVENNMRSIVSNGKRMGFKSQSDSDLID